MGTASGAASTLSPPAARRAARTRWRGAATDAERARRGRARARARAAGTAGAARQMAADLGTAAASIARGAAAGGVGSEGGEARREEERGDGDRNEDGKVLWGLRVLGAPFQIVGFGMYACLAFAISFCQ